MNPALRSIKRYKAKNKARGNSIRPVRNVGAGHDGTLSNWFPRRQQRGSERLDRERLQTRIEDVVANDGHAASIKGTLNTNVIGPGIKGRSNLSAEKLGLTPEQIAEVKQAQNDAFTLWAKKAHVGGIFQFQDIQSVAFSGKIVNGEFCYLCRYFDEATRIKKGRDFSFALQDIHPIRLRTPDTESFNTNLRDGILFDDDSEVIGYYIHNPSDLNEIESYSYYSAKNGHLPRFFHNFQADEAEQVRGKSIFAPVLKLFRDKYDFLDYEVIAQIITASFPIAIEQQYPPETGDGNFEKREGRYYQQVEAGQILYPNTGETVNPISSDRPGNNFDAFFKMILKTLSAAAGVPYHQVIKDFSETNYSSARAALLESWREFNRYRDWFVRLFLQKIWEVVIEEGYLRGYWSIPKNAPGFYIARDLWTACNWTPPAKGHIDEDKEAKANERAIATGQKSYEDFFAEQGKDYKEEFKKQSEEHKLRRDLGLPILDPANVQTYPDDPEEETPKTKAGAA